MIYRIQTHTDLFAKILAKEDGAKIVSNTSLKILKISLHGKSGSQFKSQPEFMLKNYLKKKTNNIFFLLLKEILEVG